MNTNETKVSVESTTVVQDTLSVLDYVNGTLDYFNSRLNELSIKSGVRSYVPEECKGEIQKSPENHKEYLDYILSEVKTRLNFIGERIADLERFI